MSLKEIFIKNKCDKATKHRYYELYEKDFSEFKNQDIKILEIGTFKGESTQSWIDYFDKAQIYTADTFERVLPEKVPAWSDAREVQSFLGIPENYRFAVSHYNLSSKGGTAFVHMG